ncbi:MAG: translocation/assembly module TamB, partial [Lachnospiraceae bacterium]|nr:translocation/assembly module TamB [Lachnospiraceae bacterium]
GSATDANFDGKFTIAQGSAQLNLNYTALPDSGHSLRGTVNTEGFDLGALLDNDDFGLLRANVVTDLTYRGNDILKGLNGTAQLDVPLFTFKGYPYVNIWADIEKHGSQVLGQVSVADPNIDFDVDAVVSIAGSASTLDAAADIRVCNISALNLGTPFDDVSLTGKMDASLSGNNLSNVQGHVDIQNLRYSSASQPEIVCEHLFVESIKGELPHSLTLQSDYVDFNLCGEYDLTSLPNAFKELASYFLPNLIAGSPAREHLSAQDFDFSVLLKKDSGLLEKIKSPITIFEDLQLTGSYNSEEGIAKFNLDIPYMLQGQNRLIRNTHLSLDVDTASNKCLLSLGTVIPNDKGDISISLDAKARDGKIDTGLQWNLGRKRDYKGLVSLTADFLKDESGNRAIDLAVNPSTFAVNDTVWNIDPGKIMYADKSLTVEGVKVHRPGQYALIEGKATASADDKIQISLQDIDLNYIFETLNIEYVQFGGRASGTLNAAAVFSKEPQLYTDNLVVNNIMYNRCVLGDAYINSHFDLGKKSVYLDADIQEGGKQVAHIYGDIFVVGEALDLYCDADEVNVAFLKPFIIAFCSDVKGRATGSVRLFGTFKDIDLTGKVYANRLDMKIDVLNTWYTVHDSVTLEPGSINIDNVTVYDREGHTALLNGRITHRYFHEPRFDFTFTKAKDFLVYDTNASINPIWYGTVYGSGSGTIHGVPGFIDIKVDVTTCPRSSFTFVISDTEEAETFEFLTFTDKRKEALEAAKVEEHISTDDIPWYIHEFIQKKKKKQEQAAVPTRYAMDIRVTATPEADLTIVMDPIAGDKIKANGEGSMRMSYNSEGELDLYGTYSIIKGNYNFTLQDVIVRDFKIREGSKISFTGDPFAADLDITAAYRVNTSLTDLDKSFADDRELNRTNVPVEALLKVSGPMMSPDIDFDIELPTLTEDVARKVKSIVSTSDMMNRQIVYLLALNRFYTPDYMGTSGSNNELASVASTTISSQLSSVLGELTPGWSFSPYFRTEKGDFS